MRSLGQTTADLARFRRGWETLAAGAGGRLGADASSSRLEEVTGFGPNPGDLRMLTYVPDRLEAPPALVVVLHGCTQTASGYDQGSGWSRLAERYGFALLLPEQQGANNPKTCFNWFQPGDARRGEGEARSIREMVERMVVDHGIDRGRVFVTGLSAGGAMTSVMLATYPEVFAGGAIIAGLPYGAAQSVQDAFTSMFQGRSQPARAWGDLVRAASPHKGRWPRVSVWHGGSDATVVPGNADEIVKQWTDVHGLRPEPTATDTVNGYPRKVWRGPEGDEVIEAFTITGMAHGTPVGGGKDEEAWGSPGAFLLDAGISSSYHIAKFFGLTDAAVRRSEAVAVVSPTGEIAFPGQGTGSREPVAAPSATRRPTAAPRDRTREGPAPDGTSGQDGHRPSRAGAGTRLVDVQGVITKALKAAGLLKT